MATTTRTITIPRELDPVAVFGPVDEVIREVEKAFPELTFVVRGDRVAILSRSKNTQSDADKAQNIIETIIQAAYSAPLDADSVRRMLERDVLRNHVRTRETVFASDPSTRRGAGSSARTAGSGGNTARIGGRGATVASQRRHEGDASSTGRPVKVLMCQCPDRPADARMSETERS